MTQAQSKYSHFFSSCLQKVLDESAVVSDADLFKVATPVQLAKWLDGSPEHRGNLLYAACGMERAIGQLQPPIVVESILTAALTERTETSTDPTQTKPALMRRSIPLSDWPDVLPKEKIWDMIRYGSWYLKPLTNVEQLIIDIHGFMIADGLFSSEETIRAIDPNEIGDKIPDSVVRTLVKLAITGGLSKHELAPDTILEFATPLVLIQTFGIQTFVEKVFGAFAEKHQLIEKPNGRQAVQATTPKAASTLVPPVLPAPETPKTGSDTLPPPAQ